MQESDIVKIPPQKIREMPGFTSHENSPNPEELDYFFGEKRIVEDFRYTIYLQLRLPVYPSN